MSLFNIYCTTHPHSQAVCKAVARGTKLPLVAPAPLRDGGMVTYGFLRGLLPTLKEAWADARAWVYLDRGYLGATKSDDYSGYFRATRDDFQWHGAIDGATPHRFERLGVKMRPWRTAGEHILVCPPGDVFTMAIGGFRSDPWLSCILAELARRTDRPVRIRYKNARDRTPLAADLENCHALVTYMSNTAVEALLAGVPVFVDAKSAAYDIADGVDELYQIERPHLSPMREQWLWALAENQWTLDELARGAANGLFQ